MDSNSAQFTGSIPENYDQGLGPIIFADYAADIARRTAARGPKRVLETAAGTGIVTRRLRDLLPATVQLTASDLNPPMLEVAKTKFREEEQVEFLPADATQLPFEDNSFEAVVCQFGVMFYPDKPKSFAEAFRVLKPGGQYLFNVWDAHRYNPFGRIAHEVVSSFFPSDPPQFWSVPFSYPLIDPIKEVLIEAGFGEIGIAVIQLEKVIPELTAFARAAIYGNPTADQITSRGGEPDKVVEALAEAFRGEFGTGPSRMPLQAIMFSASKPE
jgi:SAM-dependent methyltransferase